jgi:hypothetical protein
VFVTLGCYTHVPSYQINLDGPEDLNPVSMTLAPPSGSPVDIERGRDSPDPARPSKF